MKLFPHQHAGFAELHRTADAFFGKPWQHLPLRPRFNRLVVGPSGTGKTHLTRHLSAELGVAYLELCSTSWIPLGASERGARPTWLDIADFCYAHPRGIICLDEVDKLGDRTSWMNYLRVEMFGLLDKRCPANLNWRPENVDLEEDSFIDARNKVAKRLEESIFIVGAGAFQDLWDTQRDSAGFHAAPNRANRSPTPAHRRMAQVIPLEILNRFAPPILALPRLHERDYHAIVKALAQELRPDQRPRLRRLAEGSIAEAVEQQLGARWAEQLLLEFVVTSRHRPMGILPASPLPVECPDFVGEQPTGMDADC